MKTFAIFAKFWEPGKVKTRLARSLGDSVAAQIYYRFLRLSLQLVDDWQGQKTLGFTPRNRELEFRELARGWRLVPQVESDLGSRMKYFFDEVFATRCGWSDNPSTTSNRTDWFADGNPSASQDPSESDNEHRVVLIGSDTPLLPRRRIKEAFDELKHHDVVLGPSSDGGYYLIGARNRTPEIFDRMEWSTERVFSQTIDRLQQANYQYAILDSYRDIDQLEDLEWLLTELQATSIDDSPAATDLENLCRYALDQIPARQKLDQRSRSAQIPLGRRNSE